MKSNCYAVISLDNFFKPFLINAKTSKNSEIYNKPVKKLARSKFFKFINTHFHVAHNNYILNDYVHNKMLIDNELNHSKSFFLTSIKDTRKIYGIITVGAITLSISSKVSNSIKKKLVPRDIASKRINVIPAYSIEQVAKNDLIVSNPIHGNDILDVGISQIEQAMKYVGGVVVVLTAVMPPSNPGSVISVYSKYGFSKFDVPHPPMKNTSSPVKYQPMFLNLM